jgi:hypothetical protein
MMFSANPGEPIAPLARVASGGELARLMLAIKTVGADADKLPTLVFDEVDAGIGGEAAIQVGLRLKALGARHQVLVVTHLAQIAHSQTTTCWWKGSRRGWEKCVSVKSLPPMRIVRRAGTNDERRGHTQGDGASAGAAGSEALMARLFSVGRQTDQARALHRPTRRHPVFTAPGSC